MSKQASCPGPASWRALLDNTLPEGEQADLHRHLETCPECQETLEEVAAGRDSWSGVARNLAPESVPHPAALAQAIRRLKAEPNPEETQALAPPGRPDDLGFLGPSTKPGSLGRLGHY